MSDGATQRSWHSRLYRPGDETGIVALYKRVFGYERTPEWWHWKVKSFPYQVELTWVAVADDDGSIIGHYPGIPVRLKLKGEVRPAIVNLDVMTAPEFRRRGILLHLGEAANEHWRGAGYAAVVGLPNEQWGSRTEALGWITLFPLNWLRFPLHLGKAVSRPGRLPGALAAPAHLVGEIAARVWARPRITRLSRAASSTDIEVDRVSEAGPDFERLWEQLEQHYEQCVVRDANYVRWRFLSAKPEPYRVLLARRGERPTGYIAYRASGPRGGDTAYIADLFTAPQDGVTGRTLLGAALADLWDAGASMAMITAVPGSALHAMLKSLGALQAKGSFHYDLILLDPSLRAEKLSDPQRWHAGGSDSDVV